MGSSGKLHELDYVRTYQTTEGNPLCSPVLRELTDHMEQLEKENPDANIIGISFSWSEDSEWLATMSVELP